VTFKDSETYATSRGGRLATKAELQALIKSTFWDGLKADLHGNGRSASQWAAVSDSTGRDWIQIGTKGADEGPSAAPYPAWADIRANSESDVVCYVTDADQKLYPLNPIKREDKFSCWGCCAASCSKKETWSASLLKKSG
jgi:hypothetical protein